MHSAFASEFSFCCVQLLLNLTRDSTLFALIGIVAGGILFLPLCAGDRIFVQSRDAVLQFFFHFFFTVDEFGRMSFEGTLPARDCVDRCHRAIHQLYFSSSSVFANFLQTWQSNTETEPRK